MERKDIKEFFNSVYADLEKMFKEVGLPRDDFIDEIFDNIKPKDGMKIYYKDIQNSRSYEYIVRYLVSVGGLMEKENFA